MFRNDRNLDHNGHHCTIYGANGFGPILKHSVKLRKFKVWDEYLPRVVGQFGVLHQADISLSLCVHFLMLLSMRFHDPAIREANYKCLTIPYNYRPMMMGFLALFEQISELFKRNYTKVFPMFGHYFMAINARFKKHMDL